MKIKLILSLCAAVLITEPLSAAAPQGNELIQAAGNVDQKQAKLDAQLIQAAHDDNCAEVQHLIDESADPDSTNNSGDTPLCQAIIKKILKWFKHFLMQ